MDFSLKSAAEVYFRKKIRRDLQSISLDADMIRLLLVIEEHKSLYQIAAEVEMDADTFKKTLRKLLDQGLIETITRRIPLLEKSFLQVVRLNLSRVIGPMAAIVLEDTIRDMNLNPAGIPVDQAAELINRLALEIPDEGSRVQFKRLMIPIIKSVKP